MTLRYRVLGHAVTVRSPAEAGPPYPPHVDDCVTIEPGGYLPPDTDLRDLDRLLRGGLVRPENQ